MSCFNNTQGTDCDHLKRERKRERQGDRQRGGGGERERERETETETETERQTDRQTDRQRHIFAFGKQEELYLIIDYLRHNTHARTHARCAIVLR